MKRAIIMALIASTLMTGLAIAQPKAKAGEGDAEDLAARSMDAPYIAVPVVRDGRLVNYLFVSVRIDIAQGVDIWRTREKAHFLRDALVRAAHVTQMADANDFNRLDEARAIQVFQAAAVSALGAGVVQSVAISSVHSSGGAAV